MILPVGHEQGSLRRLPWVTFTIMILCVAALVATQISARPAEIASRDAGARLTEYFLEHPYLELSDDLERRVFPGLGPNKRASLIEAMRSGSRPPEADVLRREQEQLESLAREAEAVTVEHPLNRWGLVPSSIGIVPLFTHMFLHSGWLHLIGNLLILYLAGPYIEDVWGRVLFAAFYLAAGVAAALAFALRYAHSDIPLVGASGAIAGVMGAFLVRYWQTRITFLYIFSLGLRGTFQAPTWVMLPIWFLQQLLMAAVVDAHEGGGGVAFLAHAAGFAFGAAVAAGVWWLDLEARHINPRLEAKVTITHVSKPGLERALEARDAGRTKESFEILSAEAARSPDDRDVAVALWDVAVAVGRTAETRSVLERVIRADLRSGDVVMAREGWLELRKHAETTGLEAPALVKLGQALIHHGEREEGVRALRAAMLAAGTGIEPALAFRIATLVGGLDPDLSRGAARLSLSRPGLGAAEREQAARLAEAVTPGTVSTSSDSPN